MTVKINDKEYAFDGYAQPLHSMQQLAEACYQQGRTDAINELEFDIKSHHCQEEWNEGYQQGRADVIAELKPYVLTNMDDEQFLWLKVEELNKLSFSEQLKEQKNE